MKKKDDEEEEKKNQLIIEINKENDDFVIRLVNFCRVSRFSAQNDIQMSEKETQFTVCIS